MSLSNMSLSVVNKRLGTAYEFRNPLTLYGCYALVASPFHDRGRLPRGGPLRGLDLPRAASFLPVAGYR